MAEHPPRLPPPPFWRTRYYDQVVAARPDRAHIHAADVLYAMARPAHTMQQPDGQWRHWAWIVRRGPWLRVVIEPDRETVHNAFWDRGFKP
ncbi:MAG TPA: hypothetical protein VK741_00470 [Acetobacteraceae bacterium]|nr:hypothetical protein [Acetobacteraceae bacterium]